LQGALDDRIHQPYRAPLCPLLPELKKLSGASGILGVALSGAGPSVLIFIDPKASQKSLTAKVAGHIASAGLSAEMISTRISLRAGRDSRGWRNRKAR